MKPLFEYENYRHYLRDYYEKRKGEAKSYSFRFFARKAGLNSPNYYKLVMDGKRNLTHRNIRKFSKGLGLSDRDASYFENLVFYNQASDEDERTFYERNLQLLRKEDARALLTRDQYVAVALWYPLAIKELFLCGDRKASPKEIAAKFDYRFSPQQAKEAIDLLDRLGLIRVDSATGEVRVTHQNMQTPDVAQSHAVAMYHKSMIDLAKGAIDQQSAKERCLSGLTVAVRRKDLPDAFKRLHAFRNEMDRYFSERKPYDSVYQLNFQLFRLDEDV